VLTYTKYFVHKSGSISTYLRFYGPYPVFNVGFLDSVMSVSVLLMYSLMSLDIANSVYEG
jgi:hypothetical protein